MSQIIKNRYKTGWSPRKGKRHSEETKQRISESKKKQGIVPKTVFVKGRTPWNKGKKCLYVTERNLKANPSPTGSNHWKWAGDSVSYRALHKWVISKLGQPTECEYCKTTNLIGHDIHWANISKEYKRDTKDWIRLCARCHKKFDSKK